MCELCEYLTWNQNLTDSQLVLPLDIIIKISNLDECEQPIGRDGQLAAQLYKDFL